MHQSTHFSEFLSAHPVTKALVSFLDLDRTGKMRIEDFCALLLRCNYGHVPYGMVSEIWQMVDVDRAGTLDEDGLMV